MTNDVNIELEKLNITVTFSLEKVDYTETPRESIEKFMLQLKSSAVSAYMRGEKAIGDAFMSEYGLLHKYLLAREKAITKK